jgi:hypothetical protein
MRVPSGKTHGQLAPLASMSGLLQQRIESLQIAQTYIPTPDRQRILGPFKLLFRDLHPYDPIRRCLAGSVNKPQEQADFQKVESQKCLSPSSTVIEASYFKLYKSRIGE